MLRSRQIEILEGRDRILVPDPVSFFDHERDIKAAITHPNNYNLRRYVDATINLNTNTRNFDPFDPLDVTAGLGSRSVEASFKAPNLTADGLSLIFKHTVSRDGTHTFVGSTKDDLNNPKAVIDELFFQVTTADRGNAIEIPTRYRGLALERPYTTRDDSNIEAYLDWQSTEHARQEAHGLVVLQVATDIAQLLGADVVATQPQ